MNFKEYLEESKYKFPKDVEFKKATSKQIKSGENYTIIDIKNKAILKDNLQYSSAKNAVDTIDDENIIFGDSAFIYDKYISKWNKH